MGVALNQRGHPSNRCRHRGDTRWKWARDGREAVTSPGMPGAQKTGRGGKDPPLEPLEGAQHWDPLTSDIWSPGLREDRLLLF